jgi:hypothetical protein
MRNQDVSEPLPLSVSDATKASMQSVTFLPACAGRLGLARAGRPYLAVHCAADLAGQAGCVPQALAPLVPHGYQHSLHTAIGGSAMKRKDQPGAAI